MTERQVEILAFIKKFKDAEYVFRWGMCYWFAYILQGRFGGVMMYDEIENHFMQEIEGRLYDVSGDVTEKYRTSRALIRWSDMEKRDSTLYRRLLNDCVYKTEREER